MQQTELAKIALISLLVATVIVSGCVNAQFVKDRLNNDKSAVSEKEATSQSQSSEEDIEGCSFPEEIHEARATTPL